MDRDDPEQRIADLERRLAQQKRGADLPPARPDDADASRRFVAFPPSLQSKFSGKRGSRLLLVAIYAIPVVVIVLEANHNSIGHWPVIAFLALCMLGLLAAWWWNSRRRIRISVTRDALTVSLRRGDVFSFRDAQLGPWGASGGYTVGAALHLCCGPHRFVLGGRDHRIASGTRLEAPATPKVDAWLWASDFDELLAMVARGSGLDARQPAAGEPTRCLLFENPYQHVPHSLRDNLRKENWRYWLDASRQEQPILAIDVGNDAISVIDPNTNALIASAQLAQVTATPETYMLQELKSVDVTPVLIVCVPGSQPLRIECVDTGDVEGFQPRFSWRPGMPVREERAGGPRENQPTYLVSGADWLTLVEKFGLAPYLNDTANTASGPEPVPWSPPAGIPNAATGTGRGRWSFRGLAGLVLAVVFVGGWMYGLSLGVRNFYA